MSAHSLLTGPHAGQALFLISACIGFAAALPLGPVSVLTIQRGMTLGFWPAFWPTTGAVAAASVFGVAAALGSGFMASFILGNSFWLKLLGSSILLAMGARLLSLRPIDRAVPDRDFGRLQLTALNMTLVLSNPLTLAFFLAAFTLVGLDPTRHVPGRSFSIGAGIACGTLLWFGLLCTAAGFLHRRVGDVFLNRARAGVAGLFIAVSLLSAASVLLAG